MRTPPERHNPWCEPCIYYGRSTLTCDYILLEDHPRPCPGGTGCTARRTRKELKNTRKPKWDTELGRLLWLDGRKDGEIADEFGIPISTVTSYRKRHWEKGTPMAEPPTPGVLRSGNWEPVAVDVPDEDEEETMHQDNSLQIPEKSPMTALKQEPAIVQFEDVTNVYEILEAATSSLNGIQAICTADAILCLWNWSGPEALKRARAAIDHLLKKLEE